MISIKETDYASARALYDTLPDDDRVFLPDFYKTNGWYIGAYDDNRLIGVITGNLWNGHFASSTICVHPNYRRRGIGKLLADAHAKRAMEHKDLAHLTWMCHKNNAASIAIAKHLHCEWMDEENDWVRFRVNLPYNP